MTEIKRLNYFTGQFLVEKDFQDEQAYHLEMRRRHNRYLHSWGVADGLQVAGGPDIKTLRVGAGLAIDNLGQEIVLLNLYQLSPDDLDGPFQPNATVYVTARYEDNVWEDADKDKEITDKFRRRTEKPKIRAEKTQPASDAPVILLATVKLDASGNIASVNNDARRLAGSAVSPSADIAVRGLRVSGPPTTAGANKLDVQAAPRTNPGNHPKGMALYVTGHSGDGDRAIAEFRGPGGAQGIGFGFNTIYAAGPDQPLNLKASGTGHVTLSSDATLQKGLTVAGAAGVKSTLTVEGDATLQKSLTVSGSMKITGKNTLEFGAGVSGKEAAAGLIGYQAYALDALDIVGAGTANTNRKIKFWAEGGATFTGSLTIANNLSVPCGEEPLRMLRGIVNKDGSKVGGGAGFTVAKVGSGVGLYDITFTSRFPSVPGASVTQMWNGNDDPLGGPAGQGGDTRDNAVIVYLAADRMRVKTGGETGIEADRYFSFIVIGPR
jgi:hypothetical protein